MEIEIKGLELDKLNPRNFGGMCSRVAVVNSAEGESFETIATTDKAAVVIDWERWEMVREILPMRYCVLPDNDKAPVLDSHMRYSVNHILGSASNWRTTESELLCKIFISESEPKVKEKIKEKTIDSVSLGYMTDSSKTVEIPKNATVIIDGVEYKNEYEDDLPLLVRLWWKGKEVSLVAIGADDAAKIKRAMQSGIKSNDPELQQVLNTILNNQKSLEDRITINQSKGGSGMSEPTTKTAEQLREEACLEIEKSKSMFDGAFKHKADEAILKIKSGVDVNIGEYFKSLYDEVQRNGGHASKPVSHMDFSKSDAEQYSPSRAIGKILRGEKREGLEFEVSEQIAKVCGEPTSERGFFLAADFSAKALNLINQRAHSIGTPSEGGYFETDDFRPDMLKEVVRNKTVLGLLGSTVITGLNGPLVVPKIVSGLTAYTPLENIDADKSYIVVGVDEVSPKRISTATELGREQFIRTNKGLGGLDQILIRELYTTQNTKLDYEGINGTGLSGRPTGLLSMTGMSAPSMSVVSLKKIVNFIRLVAKANGLAQDMKWLNSVDVESLLRVTPVDSSGIEKLYDFKSRTIQGYPSISSNQIPSAYNVFGNWPEFYTCLWGVEELIIADQPSHRKWMVEFSLHRLANFYMRSSESFAMANDAPITDWEE